MRELPSSYSELYGGCTSINDSTQSDFYTDPQQMGDRQLDILATRHDWYSIPDHLPGRLTAKDFVFFRWPQGFVPSNYSVVLETLDNSSNTPFRKVPGSVQEATRLPHIQYGWHGRIGLIPNDSRLPVFESELVRGSTYIVPNIRTPGYYQMERHGMHIPPGL